MLALIHAHTHLRFGHGFSLRWYEIVLLPLAWMVVYPDKVLGWLFPNASKVYQIVLLELATIGLLTVGTILLTRTFADMIWWTPLALVLFCSILRLILTFVLR